MQVEQRYFTRGERIGLFDDTGIIGRPGKRGIALVAVAHAEFPFGRRIHDLAFPDHQYRFIGQVSHLGMGNGLGPIVSQIDVGEFDDMGIGIDDENVLGPNLDREEEKSEEK